MAASRRDTAEYAPSQLDADHERIGQHHRPQGVEAELRAGLGVRGDAGRVVVRRAVIRPGPSALRVARLLGDGKTSS